MADTGEIVYMTNRERLMIKLLAIAVLAFMVGLIIAPAFAHDIIIDNSTTYYEEPGTTHTGMGNTEFEQGMAMSAAGDGCVFDYAKGWQGCVAGGWFESQSAINGSIVTRVDRFMLRFNVQTDTDFDYQSYGVGGSWHF